MNNKDENNIVGKYTSLYMSTGMCLGSTGGLMVGTIIFPDNMLLGLSFGSTIGMCIGIIFGYSKDKHLSENSMIIIKIETVKNKADLVIYVSDKNEIEKQYNVTAEEMEEEEFVEGGRVAEEKDGSLVSLESE
ncbi:MAG: hypothetical protein ACRC68_05130 [Clostridium sp.]